MQPEVEFANTVGRSRGASNRQVETPQFTAGGGQKGARPAGDEGGAPNRRTMEAMKAGNADILDLQLVQLR